MIAIHSSVIGLEPKLLLEDHIKSQSRFTYNLEHCCKVCLCQRKHLGMVKVVRTRLPTPFILVDTQNSLIHLIILTTYPAQHLNYWRKAWSLKHTITPSDLSPTRTPLSSSCGINQWTISKWHKSSDSWSLLGWAPPSDDSEQWNGEFWYITRFGSGTLLLD